MASNTENEERLYVGQFTIDKLPISYTDEDAVHNGLPRRGVPMTAPFPRTFGFKINHIVHSTHSYEKVGICQLKQGNPKACFVAKPKRKSKFCKRSCRLSYNDDQWIEEETIGTNPLPGNYVWFSMKPTLPEDEEFKKAHYPVSYVQNDTSFYGPWAFTFGYSELIEAYEQHLPDDAHVLLINGGTLIYKREVCYVVIVTHSHDETHDDETFPTIMTTDEVLELSGDYTCPPTFHPRCVPPPYPCDVKDPEQRRWIGYDWKQLGHYDQVVFAVHCDWDGNSFEIELPDGQPECYFDYNPENILAYSRFHPICHSRGGCDYVERRDSERYVPMIDIKRFVPRCYEIEWQEWKKASQMSRPVRKIAVPLQKSLVGRLEKKKPVHVHRNLVRRLVQRDPLRRKPLGDCQGIIRTSAQRKNILRLSNGRSGIGWQDVMIGVIAGCVGISVMYTACMNLVK